MTAPLKLKPLDGGENKDDERGWWFSREDDYFKAQDESNCIKGFQVFM